MLLETIRLQFPNAKHLGYHFHSLWLMPMEIIRDVDLAGEYNAGGSILPFLALAFILPSEVIDKFNELVHRLSDEEQTKLAGFVDYFRATWLAVCGISTELTDSIAQIMESWHASLTVLDDCSQLTQT